MKRYVSRGDMIPDYYGIAYEDHQMKRAVCYPIPLNVLVYFFMKLLWWLKNPERN